nr:hypothetical protein [Butyrivibrio sp. WCD3002]
MVRMLELLKEKGYKQTSLSVQKANYAVKMYENVGTFYLSHFLYLLFLSEYAIIKLIKI